jgi:hypothetical protein
MAICQPTGRHRIAQPDQSGAETGETPLSGKAFGQVDHRDRRNHRRHGDDEDVKEVRVKPESGLE